MPNLSQLPKYKFGLETIGVSCFCFCFCHYVLMDCTMCHQKINRAPSFISFISFQSGNALTSQAPESRNCVYPSFAASVFHPKIRMKSVRPSVRPSVLSIYKSLYSCLVFGQAKIYARCSSLTLSTSPFCVIFHYSDDFLLFRREKTCSTILY